MLGKADPAISSLLQLFLGPLAASMGAEVGLREAGRAEVSPPWVAESHQACRPAEAPAAETSHHVGHAAGGGLHPEPAAFP